MSGLEINTKKLGEIYKEWRGNESCYDNGRPVFEADELLDFAQFCLKHEANVLPTGEGQSNIPDVNGSLPSEKWEDVLKFHTWATKEHVIGFVSQNFECVRKRQWPITMSVKIRCEINERNYE